MNTVFDYQIGVSILYRIEIEKADGNCFFFGQPNEEQGRWFELASDADWIAEQLWQRNTGSGIYARFSVVSDSDGSYSDWECD